MQNTNFYAFPAGLVGEIATQTMEMMHRPQPMFALGTAYAALAHFSGNKFVVQGYQTRLNVYMMNIGRTGCGKDSPLSALATMARHMDKQDTVISGVASGQAIIKLLSRDPQLLLTLDEIGNLIAAANNPQSTGQQADIMDVITKVFGLAGSGYSGKAYSSIKKSIPFIEKPFVTLMGATTTDGLASALSRRDVASGFLNRILAFVSSDVPPLTMPTRAVYDPGLVDRLERLTEREATTHIVVNGTAVQGFAEYGFFCDKQMVKHDHGALWARAVEHALKIAGLIAVGIDHKNPIITVEIHTIAIMLVTSCIKSMGDLLGENMHDTGDQCYSQQAQRMLIILDRAKSYTDKRYLHYTNDGWVPRAMLIRKMKLSKRAVDEIIDTLLFAEQIQTMELPTEGAPVRVYRK